MFHGIGSSLGSPSVLYTSRDGAEDCIKFVEDRIEEMCLFCWPAVFDGPASSDVCRFNPVAQYLFLADDRGFDVKL
ncbi:hypothetical protein ES702_00516 [subsurface metagenome]